MLKVVCYRTNDLFSSIFVSSQISLKNPMEKLPVEIFDLILAHLTISDWKCLRLTSRTIHARLASLSSYSHLHPMLLAPKSATGSTLLEKPITMRGIDHLLLSNLNPTELRKLIETSESFRFFLKELHGLSFTRSTTLIDARIFFDLLKHCPSLEKLDLSDYNFFFLSHNLALSSHVFPSIKRLNLSGNTHLSDYTFNRLMTAFPNLVALHLLGIPLRSSLSAIENRTFLTFENICSYFQAHQERFQALSVSFDPALSCDTQIKRLFIEIPAQLTYFHIDGSLSIATLLHLLLLFDNHLETLIVGRLILDHTGCAPLFAAISEYASSLKQLCVFLNPSTKIYVSQPQKTLFPVLNPSSSISLLPLKHLRDLDIQTLHPLNEADLINLLSASDSLARLKKLALPRNTTDDVIKSLCTKSSFARSLTHLNLSSCPSLSNRSVLFINKSLLALEELCLNYNANINDFAFIGLSICGIGKSIEWLDQTLINRQFIDDLPIWTCSISHQLPCQCQLPVYLSSSCVKLRLKDFSFDSDKHSDQTLSMLIRHPLFREYFLSINQLRHLKSLKLRQCVQLTDRLFRFAFHHLPNLKSLDLCGCEKLTDKDLSSVGQSCRSLEMIDLTGCHRITDLGRQSLRDKAKRLKSLEF